jgi:hypothetical protein
VLKATLLLISVSLAGCSGNPSTAPVRGIVTYRDKPVEGASVVFSRDSGDLTKGEMAVGKTDANGQFELTTHFASQASAKGAVPGKYVVTISKHMPPEGMSEEKYQALVEAAKKIGESGAMVPANQQPPPTVEMLPNYATASKSKLTADVPASGVTDLKFSLK